MEPKNTRASLLLGKTLLLSGKHAEGEALLDSLLAEEESAEARSLRGLARMRRRDFAGAAEDFHRANVLDPGDAMAWFNASLALERQGKSEEAAAARTEFEKVQEFQEALHQMEVAYHSNSENLDAGLELATLLRRGMKEHQARVLLETLAIDRPDDPRASTFLSEIAADAGLFEPAQAAARRALEIAPDHPRALVALSNALAAADPAQALSLARRAVEAAPRAAPAHVALARRLLDSGDPAAALREFQAARQLVPEDESLLGGAGVALARARAWEDAEPSLSAAIDKEGPRSEWLLHRGLAREGMKDTAKAIEDFRSAIEADPDELRAYEELARALRNSDRNAEADSVQQKGTEIAKLKEEAQELKASLWEDPYNEKLARHLAKLLREEGRLDEASIVLAASLEARQEW
jgi:tetratricopeptide (TPR) repeat protein